eukprot:1320589-Pleurochrysis_carterae.AAC.1
MSSFEKSTVCKQQIMISEEPRRDRWGWRSTSIGIMVKYLKTGKAVKQTSRWIVRHRKSASM